MTALPEHLTEGTHPVQPPPARANAEHLVATVRAWDRHVRTEDNDQHVDPVLTVHPAGTPDDQLPAGNVLDKEFCCLVVRWPGREALPERPVEQRATDAVPEGVRRGAFSA